MLLFEWLVKNYPKAKRQTLRRMVEDGRVMLDGQRARSLKQVVEEKTRVEVRDVPRPAAAGIAPLRILHEDDDLMVVVKPAGLLTSTVPNEKRPTAIAIIQKYLADREPRARAGVVHRLDKDAEGVLVFSKNNAAFETLKGQFYHHTVSRVYSALVLGRPKRRKDKVESDLVELPNGKVRSSRRPGAGQHAITEFEIVRGGHGYTLLAVTLQTGRKHQIRVHLSEQGTPVVGDSVYGAQPGRSDSDTLMLAATHLEFDHPKTGQRMVFDIPVPGKMLQLLEDRTTAAPIKRGRTPLGGPTKAPAKAPARPPKKPTTSPAEKPVVDEDDDSDE